MAINQYKCPNCGKVLVFKPDKQGWFCECCESLFNDDEIKLRFDFNQNSKYKFSERGLDNSDLEFAEKARLYTCKKCSCEFVTDVSYSLESCVFCGGEVESPQRISGEYKPIKVIPFSISKNEAEDFFYKWCGKRKFMPSAFKENFNIKQVYIPFQIADCIVKADATASAKKIDIRTDKKFRYTKTKEYSVERDTVITFEGIPADNFSGIQQETFTSIEPFDYTKSVEFKMDYIKDIPINSPDNNKKLPFKNVKNRCVNMSDNILRQSMKGYSSLEVSKINVNIMDTAWKYILLPVWIYTFECNGKKYEFAVNGQSGRFSGEPPISKAKILSLSVGTGLLVAILFILGGICLL